MNNGVVYNLGQGKPLISREKNYVLDRRLVSVHSEDRDITKFPDANTFDILLPETMLNVQSLRIVQASFPGQYAVFTNDYQNTKCLIQVAGNPIKELTISPGTYTPEEMALELTNDLKAQIDVSFNVFYDKITQKFWFGHLSKSFTLFFSTGNGPVYTNVNCDQPNVYAHTTNWGLGYNLGFRKKDYVAQYVPAGIQFNYLPQTPMVPFAGNVFVVGADLACRLSGDTCIYMEVDKYNSYDELYPYNQSRNQTPQIQNVQNQVMFDNNAYLGKVNSAFAKIPIGPTLTPNRVDSRTYFLQNIVHYEPPIERIVRLRFKFRFHDGRLVDFQNAAFDFSIEFNCLKSEIALGYHVRVPTTFLN